MTQVSRFRLLKLLLVFVLLVAACEPPPPRSPYGRGGDPNADARALLSVGQRCMRTRGDVQSAEADPEIQYVLGKPAADDPKLMPVREPILKELLSYDKASTASDKKKHADELRELFASISAVAALPFKRVLETDDALAVTFRRVLMDDPLADELLDILDEIGAPPAPPQPVAPSAPDETLPHIDLTDEGAFDVLHKETKEQIDKIEAAATTGLPWDPDRPWTQNCKQVYRELSVPTLRAILEDARQAKDHAFKENDSSRRADALKRAGDATLAAIYTTQISLLHLRFVLDTAAADKAGVPGANPGMPDGTPLNGPIFAYERDEAILRLTQAAMEGDGGKMAAALPKAMERFQYHVEGLDQWKVSIHKGAVASEKAIKLANIVMIAISIYQAWKIPVVVGGGTPPPPVVVGALPGGVAIGSQLNIASVASALEAIRRLVAIGALDGALVGGLMGLSGSPNATFPELQRPSLSVQNPNAGGGSSAVQPAKLKPYGGSGGGHHVGAKRAFEGAPNYDPNKALAIPNDELERLGIAHPAGKLTNAQRKAYIAFAKTGKLPTWEDIARIETDALVEGGMKPDMAQATVAKAIKALKDAGVAGPVRTPWGGK